MSAIVLRRSWSGKHVRPVEAVYALTVKVFLVFLVAAVVGIVVNMISAELTDRIRPGLAGLAGALVALGLLHVALSSQSTTPADDQPRPTTAAQRELQSALASRATETPSTSQSEAASASSPTSVMATSLLDLPEVEQDSNDTTDLDIEGTIEINGKTYGRALVYECSLFCNGSSPQTRLVTLADRFSRLTADAAVLDTKDGDYRIDITLDSSAPVTYNVRPGKTTSIDLDVTGVSRMRIQMYAPGPLKNPLQAGADSAVGENGGGLPGVALGDPVLLP